MSTSQFYSLRRQEEWENSIQSHMFNDPYFARMQAKFLAPWGRSEISARTLLLWNVENFYYWALLARCRTNTPTLKSSTRGTYPLVFIIHRPRNPVRNLEAVRSCLNTFTIHNNNFETPTGEKFPEQIPMPNIAPLTLTREK